jgi:hypothetical protein
MNKSKSLIISFLLIWLTGGGAFFHNHPFLPGALSISDTQTAYAQHENIISGKTIPCPACLWERTPTDSPPVNLFAILYPEFPLTFEVSTAPQLSSLTVHLSPRSPPLFS